MDEQKHLPLPVSVTINRSRSFSTGIELGLWARSQEEDEREFQQNLKVVKMLKLLETVHIHFGSLFIFAFSSYSILCY